MKPWHLLTITVFVVSGVFAGGWWLGDILMAAEASHTVAPVITYSPTHYWTEELRGRVTVPDAPYEFFGFSDTGSMKPTLDENSYGIFFPTQDARIGDVVVFERDGQTRIHRIVGEQNGMWITKGDATTTPDPDLLDKGAVTARLVAIFY